MLISVCGAGALGSNFVFVGRNIDVQYRLIDFDRVEQKNISSQFYNKQNLGKNKAMALAQNMINMYGKKCDAAPYRLSKDNLEQLLGKSDIIIDCFDNPDSRELLQQYCIKNNIPCLHGGLAANGQYGIVAWNSDFSIEKDNKTDNQPTCQNGDHSDFIMIVASYMITSLKKFISDKEKNSYHINLKGVFKI